MRGCASRIYIYRARLGQGGSLTWIDFLASISRETRARGNI